MNKPKFYFGYTKKKKKSPTEMTSKRQYDFKDSHYREKKNKICPVCNKEKDKLTTDHQGNVMCGACFIQSL